MNTKTRIAEGWPEMKLDEVKQARCDCGNSYPLAHWIRRDNDDLSDEQDKYKKHKNMRCAVCIRAEMSDLNDIGTQDSMARFRKLSKLLGPA